MAGASDVPGDHRGSRRGGRTVWWVPTLLALAVTATGVGRAQPWRDELATWSAATRPLPDLARLVSTVDATAGLWYLLTHGWVTVLGDSATALRAPSVLAMSAAAGVTGALGGRIFGTRAGLLAGLLFAVLPSTSRYGQEARPYALATLLAVASTVLLVDALRSPTRRRWAGYAIVVALLGLAHLVALGLLAAHAVAVTTTAARRLWWRWVLSLAPAALALTPVLLLAAGQHSRQLSWVDAARLGELPGLPGSITASAAVGGLLVGLAVVGVLVPAGPRDTHRSSQSADDRRRWGVVMLSAVLLPAALLFTAGLVTAAWVPRYLVFTAPFLCVPAGALLAPVRVAPALAVVGVAAVLGAPAQLEVRRTHDWPRSSPVDYRAAARVVAAGQRPGDGIVYSPRDSFLFLDLGLAYHLGTDRPRDVLVARDQRRAGDLWAVECARPVRCLTGVDRVWLVVAGRPPDPVAALPEGKAAALRGGFTPTQRWDVPGITLILLTRM